MKKVDLLVIGGSAGGILSANTAKKVYKDKRIAVIRDTKTVMVPCGIPYIYGNLKDTSKNRIPDKMLTDNQIELIIDKVTKINKEEKYVVTDNNEKISYEKLIIATGSLPVIPSVLGKDLENVFSIYKDEVYLSNLLEKMSNFNNIVVIGGGFIGVEFSEQMQIAGKNVTLLQRGDKCLRRNFDPEFSDEAESLLKENGINVKTNCKIKEFVGNKKVEGVKLESGEIIKADAVVLGAGVKANSTLAKEAGIKINADDAIIVDENMVTSDADIFAVGDCAEKVCFFTRNPVSTLLASTAALEAKIAGYNAFKNKLTRKNNGTISAFSTKIYGTAFASAGLTEKQASDTNFDIITGEFTVMDKHPGSLPNTKKLHMKLIFSKYSGIILGGEISGGDTVGEMINIISLAIQQGMTATDLNTFQVATHPLLTASPIAYPINGAAMDAIGKM